MTHDDLPIIQCPPGPTDAELEAERDTKHAAAVADWMGHHDRLAEGLTSGAVADTEPRTVAEQLDAAETGEQWGNVLSDWLSALGKAKHEADE